MANKRSEFAQWLRRKHLEAQAAEGRRIMYAEFAGRLGISTQMFSLYVNSKNVPSDEALVRIAEVLGKEVYEVLGRVPADVRLRTLLLRLERLDPDSRELAYERLLAVLDELAGGRGRG
jgi:transcriptional regulator with XRE-family HTH domain